MSDLNITQLEQQIIELRKKLENEWDWKGSLTPEQEETRRQFWVAHKLELNPLLELKAKLELEEKIKKALEENPIIKEVEKEVSSNTKDLAKTASEVPLTDKKRHHYLLPLLKKTIAAKCHTWLVGPAGSGKSTLASGVASELKMSYAALSVCSQTTKTDLLGYLDANGVYRSTSFRRIYENGGVFCLDEIDNGNANVLAVLNSALANESNEFPDKTVKRHPNFVVVACANTYGLGATGGYVGRVQIDAATLDRFFFIEMPYDDGLESHIAGSPGESSPAWMAAGQKVPTVDEWLATVRRVRNSVDKLGIRAIISPRATYAGMALIKQGVPLNLLEKGLLFKSMSDDLITKILQS
jgi:cobaltochelatase CobS